MAQQKGMFESVNSDDVLEHLADTQIEQRHRWPETLTELINVLTASMRNQGAGEQEAKQQGIRLALDIADHFGGMQLYVPKGKLLKTLARNIQIWHDFTGDNAKALARQYGLSEVRLYEILREQTQLQVAKHQGDLFKTDT